MNIIRTWAELAAWLDHAIDPDIASLLQLRRAELIECGELTGIGTFAIVEQGDMLGDIETALGVPVVIDGAPTFEWVMRHGKTYEAPIIVSDGFGHVLIVPNVEGIDPRLLALCRAHV